MKGFILLCCFAVLTACEGAPPLPEVARQETVTVYACGGWLQPQIDQIKAAIDDLNLNARYENKNKFFVYGSEKPGLYGSGENSGIRCVYWIYENYPTEEGRDLWEGARPEDESDSLAGEYDGDNVFVYGNGACAPNTSCTWMMQNVVAHELGHALGAEHLAEGSHAVMTTPASSWRVTGADVKEICRHASCDSSYTAPAARLAEDDANRPAPAKFRCLH